MGLPYIETSAATGEGVDEAVEALLALVMDRIDRSVDEMGERVKRRNRLIKWESEENEKQHYCPC